MDSVTHHGREVAYRHVDAGNGAPVLYVHGSGGTHEVWERQLADPPAGRPAVAIDLSGHGASDDVDTEAGPETLEAYAEDAVAVARETGATALVGNSLGGAVVLAVLLDTGFDPEAAVLHGTGAKLGVRGDLLDALDDDFDRAVELLHEPDLLLHTRDPDLLGRSEALVREVGQVVTRRDLRTCNRFDVRERLGEVGVPVLALTGEYDNLTPPSYHEYLAEHIPDAAWTTLPDAAHLSMLEAPGELADEIAGFLG